MVLLSGAAASTSSRYPFEEADPTATSKCVPPSSFKLPELDQCSNVGNNRRQGLRNSNVSHESQPHQETSHKAKNDDLVAGAANQVDLLKAEKDIANTSHDDKHDDLLVTSQNNELITVDDTTNENAHHTTVGKPRRTCTSCTRSSLIRVVLNSYRAIRNYI